MVGLRGAVAAFSPGDEPADLRLVLELCAWGDFARIMILLVLCYFFTFPGIEGDVREFYGLLIAALLCKRLKACAFLLRC